MAERILIVDDDVDTMRLVGIMLQRQGYQIVAASNGSQGLEKAVAEKPDLILLDVMMPDMDGYEVTRRLRKNPITAAIPVLMFTAKTQLDDKVTGFEVGADDYLTKPTHPTELQSHVKALLARTAANKTDEIKTHANQDGYVIGVIAVRGGLGVSTFSANIAAALLNSSQEDVIFAELTPGHGTLAGDFGLPNQKGLTEILQSKPAEITKEKVRKALVKHNSGLKLLLASESPRDVELISQVQNFELLVSHLSSLARFVVLDLGSGLPTYAQKLLSISKQPIVVLEGTASNIQHTKLLMDEMVMLRIKRENITAILNNRQRSDAQMSAANVQEKLGHPIAATLTPAPEIFLQAARVHSPAVISQPSSMTSQQFLKIADAIIKREKA
jgi:CheY-like chemotaxis protein/MinD-like ATPase involved in chromosome partitioning or flagellar assembly